MEELIRSNFTDNGEELSDRQVDNFVWHCTAFPMASKEKVEDQVHEMAEKTSEYHEVMSIAEKQIEEAMEEFRNKQ